MGLRRARMSVMGRRCQAGPAETRHVMWSPTSVGVARAHGQLETDLGHSSNGPGPIRLSKGFSFIQTCSDLLITKLILPELQSSPNFV
jgi:hypothetical protein